MTIVRLSVVAGALVTVSLAGPAVGQTTDTLEASVPARPIVLAQAPISEEERKRREAEQKKKGPPPPAKAQPQQQPPAVRPPPPAERRTQNPPAQPKPPADVRAVPADPPRNTRPIFERKDGIPRQGTPVQPAPDKNAAPTRQIAPTAPSAPRGSFNAPVVPQGSAPATGAAQQPFIRPGAPAGQASPALERVPGAIVPAPALPAAAVAPRVAPAGQTAAPAPKFDALKSGRQQTVEDSGRRTVIRESGNRTIIRQDNRVFIQSNDTARFQGLNGARTEQRPGGLSVMSYARPDGSRVLTETDANGRMLRRYRQGADGREHTIIDNRKFWRNAAIGVGAGVIAAAIIVGLTRPAVAIPRHHYIVDYDRASDDDLYVALTAPPVDRLDRAYSLEEVRYNQLLRERMRRIDVDAVTFDSGAYEIGPEQFPKLERLARAILRALRNNPDEVFMVEGHTDATGTDVDNLSLSDRRAESVAHILSDTFGVPPENLVTQGYGEQYPKIESSGPERLNRRVSVRRITPLMAER